MNKFFLMIFCCCFLFACQSVHIEDQVSSTELEQTQGEEVGLTIEELCESAPCRVNARIKFRTDKELVDQIVPLYWPAAYQDQISFLPGDELLIEAEEINGALGNFKLVDKITNPDKTLQFSFTQRDDKVDMMLSVKNPFSKTIKYHLNMIDFSQNPHKTSSCPVKPKIVVFEHWPHVIPELVLTDMHFIEESDSFVCEY